MNKSLLTLGALVTLLASPVPGFNRATAPLTQSGSTVGIRAGSTTQTGYITTAQSIAIASLAAHTPTPLPNPLVLEDLEVTDSTTNDGTSHWYGGTSLGGDIYARGAASVFKSDTFTRANSNDITGSAVQVGGGTWGYTNTAGGTCTPAVVSNALTLHIVGACGGTLYTDISQTDAYVGIKVVTNAWSGDAPGVVVRANGSGNGYVVTFTNGNAIRIRTLTGWNPNGILALYSVSYNNGDTIAVSAVGTTITAYLNGTSLGSVTDSTYTTGTNAGVYMEASGGTTFSTWSATTTPVAPELIIRGDYNSPTRHATITLGEGAHTGSGGMDFDIPDASGWDEFHDAVILDSSLSVAKQITSTVSTGSAPFVVSSTTKVTNLNADLLDGLSSADFIPAGHVFADVVPLVSGGATPTVASGSICTCTDRTAVNTVQCSVTGSVLTISGTGTDSIAYICVRP